MTIADQKTQLDQLAEMDSEMVQDLLLLASTAESDDADLKALIHDLAAMVRRHQGGPVELAEGESLATPQPELDAKRNAARKPSLSNTPKRKQLKG